MNPTEAGRACLQARGLVDGSCVAGGWREQAPGRDGSLAAQGKWITRNTTGGGTSTLPRWSRCGERGTSRKDVRKRDSHRACTRGQCALYLLADTLRWASAAGTNSLLANTAVAYVSPANRGAFQVQTSRKHFLHLVSSRCVALSISSIPTAIPPPRQRWLVSHT